MAVHQTPTHSYMHGLYKYPQQEFPYEQLLRENAARGRDVPEYELSDTGIFDRSEYFDVSVEYAKADDNDICIRLRAFNRRNSSTSADEADTLHIIPSFFFRNSWDWGCKDVLNEGCWAKPRILPARELKTASSETPVHRLRTTHATLEHFCVEYDPSSAAQYVVSQPKEYAY